MTTPRPLLPLVRVALPVAVAGLFVCLAIVNVALVKTWSSEPDDGVFWLQEGANVVAREVAPAGAGAAAGLRAGDVLFQVDGAEITSPDDVTAVLHGAVDGQILTYVVQRASADVPLRIGLRLLPTVQAGLYYSLALVGILGIIVGASVRLRRPNDSATLHFFWLTVAFFGMLAFTPSGRYDTLDYFFDWSDAVARVMLPPLFLHFAFVFPDRPNAWVRGETGRMLVYLLYLPAAVLGLARVVAFSGGLSGTSVGAALSLIETAALLYLAACLLGGLLIMTRALAQLRSVTARRQLRWVVWGSSTGALPFVLLYVVPFLVGRVPPFAEYTAVLLGCIPLAFASAIVRYRLMDVEVIIKKTLMVAAYLLFLAIIYGVTLQVIGLLPGTDADPNRFWALLATLVVVLVAPWIQHAIQAGLDRLYYRDRYDYRRALVGFARDLNSDLDLDRLSTRLVERVRETLVVDRLSLLLGDPSGGPGAFAAVAAEGMPLDGVPAIRPDTGLSRRLMEGHTVAIGDPTPARRFTGDETTPWRDAELYSFVPCVSKDGTIAVLAAGRRAHGEPLSSEDMALLGTVAGQAATALENARLYRQLSAKADEIEQLHQFSNSVIESLTAGLMVVDQDDRVLRWNRRMETLTTTSGATAVGQPLADLFPTAFVARLATARHNGAGGQTLYRVPMGPHPTDEKRSRLVNVSVSRFQSAEGAEVGWIVGIEDITDRASLEEQLQLSEKMAAIGLLAAGVAHEVNTPLTGISSFTQMLLERSDPADPRTGLLEKIERQTFRAAKIVNSLLNLARPTGGETGPVDLNAIIADVLALLEHQFRSSRVQVRRTLADQGLVVQGVEYKLQQVFLNLFLNARDAMPKGGWLSIETRREGGHAVVEVADTGVGIETDLLARIYDPFFTTKADGSGTGLGLSVTYGIVQEHGGTLTCESQPGHGTRFRLMLRSQAAAAEVAAR